MILMNKLLFPFLLLMACHVSSAQDKAIAIRILQNGQPVTMQNGVLLLEKKPFTIEVSLTNTEGVYVLAGFNDSVYRLNFDQPIPGLNDLGGMVVAEAEFNKDKELTVM